MATRTVCPEQVFLQILQNLESSTNVRTCKCENYAKLSMCFNEGDCTMFSLLVAKDIKRLIEVLKLDVLSDEVQVTQAALEVLGVCLHDCHIVSSISDEDCSSILKALCDTLHKSADKVLFSRALWCIEQQNLPDNIVMSKVGEIIAAVEYALNKCAGVSVTVEYESIKTIERLIEQVPIEMMNDVQRWGRILLPMIVHSVVKVRELAHSVLDAAFKQFKEKQKIVLSTLKPVVLKKVIPELKNLFQNKQEIHVLQCFCLLVLLFDEELHNVNFVNELLPLVQLGFTSPLPDVKIATFLAWQQLIDNFALNPVVLNDHKRLKLIMQVFSHNNAKNENVAMVKLKVWWHFIRLLGCKISPNFDMVAAPLLQFCVGGRPDEYMANTTPNVVKGGSSPLVSHGKLISPGLPCYPVFRNMQLMGCEALARFLGSEVEGLNYSFQLESMRNDVVTGPSFFVKHSMLFISTATELFCSLGQQVSDVLVMHIWNWLITHLKNAIDSPVKLDIRDTLSTFLLKFQVLVISQNLSVTLVLKMFQGLCSLPTKVLSSSVYNIETGKMVHGTPAVFLAGLLFTPFLLQSCAIMESYKDLFSSVISKGIGNSTGTLRYLQSVLKLLNRSAQLVDNSETLWHLWNSIMNPFLEHITKLSVKALMKTWTELYKTVNRLAAMVTNAEANIICEEICQLLVEHLKSYEQMEITHVDLLVQMCHVMVSCLDFSSLGNQSTFLASPTKWTKKRNQPLENIYSFVCLLATLQKHALSLGIDLSKKSSGIALQNIFNTQVDIYLTVFSHVSSKVLYCVIEQLAESLANLYHEASKKPAIKVFNNAFHQKLEMLWHDICIALQSRTVLNQVTEKLLINLPGLNSAAPISTVVEEGTASQMTQMQAPEPYIPGMPSPHKIYSSILNKPASPRFSKSPVHVPVSPKQASSLKKKMPLLERFNDTDFVVIKSSPKKKMVLTEHQREVMKEKRVLPDRYNSLENFIDVSLMANHFTTETQLDGSQSEQPTPAIDKPYILFGTLIPNDNGQKGADTTQNDQIQSDTVAIKGQSKHLAPPTSSKVTVSLNGGKRQSVRLKNNNNSDRIMLTEKNDKTVALDKNAQEKETNKEKERSNKKSSARKSSQRSPDFINDSVIVINDSEPIIVESQSEAIIQERTFVKLKDLVDKNYESNDEKQTHQKIVSIDMEATQSPANQIVTITSLHHNSNRSLDSFSQNAFCITAPISVVPKVSNELLSFGMVKLNNNFNSNKEHNKDFQVEEKENNADPLLSWAQKLNEYNNSPMSHSQMPKLINQDTSKSQTRRDQSLLKSPKCNKKVTNENEDALDKWVIRSPSKALHFPDAVKEMAIVANLTQTVVEETQSPTKFACKDKIAQPWSSSVMEMPPKNVLENLPITHISSNRKLFSSQGSNPGTDLNEDSNIIPASPCSTHFSVMTGTPVLKLKKLTNDEIKRCIPPSSNDKKEQKDSPCHSAEKSRVKSIRKLKYAINLDNMITKNESSHKHDDFSVFKPLDSEQSREDNETRFPNTSFMISKGAANLLSGPLPNFSLDSCIQLEENIKAADNVSYVTDAIKDTTEYASVSPTCDSSDNQRDPQEFQVSDEAEISYLQKDVIFTKQNENSRIGRMRKQTAPKKMLACEAKQKMAEQNEEVNAICSKKVSLRLKEQKERNLNQETEKSLKNSKENISSNNINKRKMRYQDKKLMGGNVEKEAKLNVQVADAPPSFLVNMVGTNDELVPVACEDDGKASDKPAVEKQVISGRLVTLKKIQNEEDAAIVVCVSKEVDQQKCIEGIDLVAIKNQLEQKPEVIEEVMHTNKTEQTAILQDSIELMGQKTPESRNPTKLPERRSTTEYKKAMVEKMIQKRSRDVVINDSDSSLDVEEVPLNTIRKTTVECLEEKLTKLVETDCTNDMNLEREVVHVNEKISTDNVEESTDSDDYILLIEIIEKVNKRRSKNNDHIKSSLSPKGRSADVIKKRLRSAEELETSSQAKKSVSLALKRARSKEAKQKLLKHEFKEEINMILDVDNKHILTVPDLTNTKNVLSRTVENVDEISKEISNDCVEVIELPEVNLISSEPSPMYETPKKSVCDSTKQSVDDITDKSLDSNNKLIADVRKSETISFARRSILKIPSISTVEVTSSPKRAFHPISPIRIYSPTASPSASILKKRRLIGNHASDTYSPPSKQRRVSFATPLVEESLCKSSADEKVTEFINNTKITADDKKMICARDNQFNLVSSSTAIDSQSTQASSSQRNYESSEDVDFNSTKPVFPGLLNCDQSVEKILPQLTSSIWSRGLGQLVRARNIHTIGDLCALTESDIHSLPIKSPKVDTVRNVLSKFGQKNKMTADTTRARQELKSEKDVHSDYIDAILASSAGLLEEVNRLSQKMEDSKSDEHQKDHLDENLPQIIITVPPASAKMLTDMMAALDVGELHTNELFQLQKSLINTLIQVSNALSARCHSPTGS